MVNLGNYFAKLALAMLQATQPDQLTEEASAKAQRGGPTETLQRLERELAAVQADTRLMEEGYGPTNLQLEIIKHIAARRFWKISPWFDGWQIRLPDSCSSCN